MSARLATLALALALGVALPACKKKPEPDPVPNAPQPSDPVPNPAQPKVPPPKGSRPKAPNTKEHPGSEPTPPKVPLNYVTDSQHQLDTRNNLRRIALAVLSAEAAHKRIPFAIADQTGKPGLSWRVAVLPYLEREALYKRFKLDEPWDSPHNIQLADEMPQEYAAPGTKGRYTFYRVFTGANAAFPPPGTARPGALIPGADITSVRDGNSLTFLMAEAFDPVVWTKPDELVFDSKRAPKLGGVYADGFHALLCDGSTKFVRKTVSERTILAAIGTNDGEPVDFSK